MVSMKSLSPCERFTCRAPPFYTLDPDCPSLLLWSAAPAGPAARPIRDAGARASGGRQKAGSEQRLQLVVGEGLLEPAADQPAAVRPRRRVHDPAARPHPAPGPPPH